MQLYFWIAVVVGVEPNLNNGEPGGTRTRDHRIKSAMLYQLSYRPNYVQESPNLKLRLESGMGSLDCSKPCMTSLLVKA